MVDGFVGGGWIRRVEGMHACLSYLFDLLARFIWQGLSRHESWVFFLFFSFMSIVLLST